MIGLYKVFGILLLGGIFCFPYITEASGITSKVRTALEYLNRETCPIEESQKLDYLCKTVTNQGLSDLIQCAKENVPCLEISKDFSSMTTSTMGKTFTINTSLQNILCGRSSFSMTPSDGCVSAKDIINSEKEAKEIVDQWVIILTNCLDTKDLFDISPRCVRMWDSFFASDDNPLRKIKNDLVNMIRLAPFCDTECKEGKDSDGFVTETCCQENGGVFVMKNNKSFCCPTNQEKCPSQQEPTEKCVSSCRMGTEKIGDKCCPANQISNSPMGKKCCDKNMTSSIYDEENSFSICCKPGEVAISNAQCCLDQNIIEQDGKKICCPSERLAFAKDDFRPTKVCCSKDEIPARGYEFGNNICCKPEDVVNNEWCCNGDRHKTNEHCCKKGEIWIDEP